MAQFTIAGFPREERKPRKLSSVDFIANVSHEIRNPLMAIIGLSHLLKSHPSPEKEEEYIEGLVQTSENLLETLNNLLDYSKLGSGLLKFNEMQGDLKAMVTRGLYGQKIIAEAKGLDFILDLDDNIPSSLMLDGVKVNQILINLVSNAIKFTTTGEVKVKAELLEKVEEQFVLSFEVRDTGRGIPEEYLERVFKPFDQGNGETNVLYGGTGLGLTISKNLIEMMGGCLEVESNPGCGTSIRFILRFKMPPQEEISDIQISDRLSLDGRRVLVVDDNRLNRLVTCRTLEQWKMIPETAANGEEALFKIENGDFDLVMMDLQMPVMDGTEATRRIRELEGEKYRDLPIIALTGSMVGENLEQLRENGFTNFLVKPFLPDDLLKVVSFNTCCTP